MSDAYTYEAFRIEPGVAWADAAALLRRDGGLAAWRGEIGVSSDEGAVLLSGSPPPLDAEGVTPLGREALASTLRPAAPAPLTEPGIYAHRRFELDDGDWEEFLALSEAAWPDFEAVNSGCQILGLWRSSASAPGSVSALLVTRYPSLAAWERSRPYAAQPLDEDKLEAWMAAKAAFARRAELTKRSIVRTYRLLSLP